jgi:hypothetical protein
MRTTTIVLSEIKFVAFILTKCTVSGKSLIISEFVRMQ